MDHRHKCNTIKCIKDNIQENLDDLGRGDIFLDITAEVQASYYSAYSTSYCEDKNISKSIFIKEYLMI